MKCKHNTLIFLAGIVWLIIGIFLLSLGIDFALEPMRHPFTIHAAGKFSLATYMEQFVSDKTQVVALIITLALLLGYFKGKMVLSKSVKRQIKRIMTLPNPTPLKYLYSKGYYLLVALMISLGVCMKWLPITPDTRGAIDIAIGSALINGATLYFRFLTGQAYLKKKTLNKEPQPYDNA